MKKTIIYLLLFILIITTVVPQHVSAAGSKTNPLDQLNLINSALSSTSKSNVLTIEWLSQNFNLPEVSVLEQLNKGYSLSDIHVALQSKRSSDQSIETLLHQLHPSVLSKLNQLDYSSERFSENNGGSVASTVYPVTSVNANVYGDASLLHPSVTSATYLDQQGRMMMASSIYPTSYDQLAFKRMNIKSDIAPYSIGSAKENISTVSGSLSMQATDMVLPGRNGLSFSLTRTYDTSDAQYYDKEMVFGSVYDARYYPELVGRVHFRDQHFVTPPHSNITNFYDMFYYQSHVNYFGQSAIVYYPTSYGIAQEFNDELREGLSKTTFKYSNPDDPQSYMLFDKHIVLQGVPLIARYYTTGKVLVDPSVMPHNRGYAYGNRTKPKRSENRFPIGKGWSWDIPYIENKDSKQYIHLSGGSTYELDGLKLKGYPWKDLELVVDYDVPVNVGWGYILKSLDGRKLYFTAEGYLKKITDAYDNTIQFEYQDISPYGTVLTKVKDAIGNEINISYSVTEVIVTSGDRTVKYDKIKDAMGNKELLSQVTDAVGRKTQYVYEVASTPFDLVGSGRMKDNYTALLKQVYHPTKARTDYSYSAFDRTLGYSAKELVYRVATREDVVTYTDGTASNSNRVDYSYIGDGAIVQQSSSAFATTVNNGRTQSTYNYDRVYIDDSTPEVYYNTQVVVSDGVKQKIDTMEYNRAKRWPVPIQVTSKTKQGASQSTASTVSRTFDDYGNVLTETDPYNNTTLYTYDAATHLLSTSTAPVKAGLSLYTELERYPTTNSIKTVRLKENNASGALKGQTSYSYDSYGNPITVTLKDDARDIVVSNEYDFTLYKAGYPTRQSIQVTGSDNQNTLVSQQFQYKLATGEMTSYTDGKGQVTQYEFDKLGRVTKVIHPDQSAASAVFDDSQNQVTAVDETGVMSVVKWNPLGLKVAEGIVGKATTAYGYDGDGRLSYSEDGAGNRSTYTYDAWDRVVRTQLPGTDNAYATVQYDDIQRTVQTTDPEGNIVKETVDLLGRPIQQEALNAAGALMSKAIYTYDYVGNPLTQTDAKGFKTSYAYDVLGRLVTVTDPEASATQYAYTMAGNLKETQYPDQNKVTKQYDQMGRVIRKTDPSGGVESYFYDANSNLSKVIDRKGQVRTYGYNNRDMQTSSATSQETIVLGYDSAGRRVWMQDGTGKTQYSYEPGSGWLKSVTYPDTRQTQYEYDSRGIRTKMTDPFGVVTAYRYDARNQLDAVGPAVNNWDATYTYKKNGLSSSTQLRNGILSTYGYDERNLTSLTQTKAGSAIGAFAYQYDQNRNQTGKTENASVYTFGYDPLNRIATSTQFNEKYTYDLRGNRQTLESDALPNLATMNYSYDDRDRLTQVMTEGNGSVVYRYNGDGLLTERTEAGVTTRYYYDGANIIAEGTVSNGTVTHKASYIRGNALVARVDANGNKAYYSHNGHGDVTGLTDGAGNVLNTYTYDIWGNSLTESETVPNLFRYSGEYWDDTTGLQYLRARWYDPSVGRFINEDSYEGQLNNPLTLNLYTYAQNNPLIYTDPTGHKVYLIHGTFSDGNTWTDDFVDYSEKLFNEESEKLNWTGKDSNNARSNAADTFVEQVYAWHLENPDEPIRLVGHSHGGNVAIMLTNLMAEKGVKVETLITIATPVRGYKLKTEVGQHINMYNNRDFVQTELGVPKWKIILGISGSRKMKGADNVRAKDAEKKGTKIQAHSSMHSNIDIWKKYIEPILKL